MRKRHRHRGREANEAGGPLGSGLDPIFWGKNVKFQFWTLFQENCKKKEVYAKAKALFQENRISFAKVLEKHPLKVLNRKKEVYASKDRMSTISDIWDQLVEENDELEEMDTI